MSLKKKRKVIEKKKCLGSCGREYSIENFYVADRVLYPDGKFHLCKSCVNKIIEEHGFQGFMMILRAMNKPFLEEIWDNDYGKYFRVICLPQYKNLNYEHSTYIPGSNVTVKNVKTEESKAEVIDLEELKELEEYWGKGKGLSIEDYRFLQNEFDKLRDHYECDTYAMEMLFQEIAHLRLTIKKLREQGKSVDKELKTLQDLLGSANIKPVQETGANAPEQATFGTLIKKWENERPIPEPDEAWKDVDGIGKYVRTWFFGHLARMLGLKGEFMEEYEKELEKYTVSPPQYEDGDDE